MKKQSKLFAIGLVSAGTLFASGCNGATSANDNYVDLWEEAGGRFQIDSDASLPRGTYVEASRNPQNSSENKNNGTVPMRFVRITQIEGWVPAEVLESCNGQDQTGSCVISNP